MLERDESSICILAKQGQVCGLDLKLCLRIICRCFMLVQGLIALASTLQVHLAILRYEATPGCATCEIRVVAHPVLQQCAQQITAAIAW